MLEDIQIVLVDDDEDARTLSAVVLRIAGAKVFEADNAVDGFYLVADRKPDVIVSDLAMPCEDGYSLIRRIRSMSAVAAIALSAFSQNEDRVRSTEAGFDLHLPKPCAPYELVSAVCGVIQARA